MHFLDFVVLIPLLYGMYLGFSKGAIIEVSSILALVIAAWVCLKLSPVVIDITSIPLLKEQGMIYFVYVLLFILTYLTVFVLGIFMDKTLKLAFLNIFNRLAGAVFGAFKLVFMVSLLFWVSAQFDIFPSEHLEGTLSYDLLYGFAPGILKQLGEWLPVMSEVVEQTENYLEDLLREIPINGN